MWDTGKHIRGQWFSISSFWRVCRPLSVLNEAADKCYHSAPAPCPVLGQALQGPGLKVTCPHFLSSHALLFSHVHCLSLLGLLGKSFSS